MENVSDNNKRIAKNTLMLYFRMVLIMGVNLYTVRVVLDTLGPVDYGLYNVVGGVVSMFSFLSGTMSTASQRFFAFEIGRKNFLRLKQTFSMTMTIYILLGVVIFILAETVGLWIINTQMMIPIDRMESARWVYQFSIFSFMMTMFTVPYNAAIIAHERMKIYAWVSIIEVLLKLFIVYILIVFSFDKLTLYAVLMFVVTTLVTLIYRIYCVKKFEECKFTLYWEKGLFKEIVTYSGWNLFGALASVFNNQGINIVLNVFFGPLVNAAHAIASQVNSAINQFVQNFIIATRPQITKYYAAGERIQMIKLVFQSSKFSFLLLFILTMPVLIETDFIMKIWLKEIPEYVILFTRLVIISALIDSLSYPLMATAQATGKVRNYQSIVGAVMLLNLPLSYLFLKLHFPAQIVFYLSIINSIVCLFLRLILLHRMVNLPVRTYLHRVLIPISLVAVIAYIVPLILLDKMGYGIVRFVIIAIVGFFISVLTIYLMVLSRKEKYLITKYIKIKMKHL